MIHSNIQKTVSPVDGRVYVERPLASCEEINETLSRARHAFVEWRNTSLAERAAILTRFCEEFEKHGARSPTSSPGRWAGPRGTRRTKFAARSSVRGT